MKRTIDFEKADEAEIVGALAIRGASRRPVQKKLTLARLTPILEMFVELAKEAGAAKHPVHAGRYNLRIQSEGSLLISRKRAA